MAAGSFAFPVLLIFFGGVIVPSTNGLEKVANSLVALAIVVLMVRVARLGLFAEPSQLMVRDIFRTYKISWSEIAGFEVPPPHGTWRKTGIRIRLLDGRVISATLYTRGSLERTSLAARRVIDELARLLAESKARAAAG